jgi:hypothetical protein
MQNRTKTMWFSSTPNTIEAKRINLVQNFAKSKQSEQSLLTSQDRIENENRRNLRPSMSDMAADGFIGTAMKSCILKHPTHLDQRPLRPPKLLQTKPILFSFGGLRGLWSRCAGCLLWMQLFMAVPMTPSAAMSDIDDRRFRRFSPILGSSPPLWRPCSCHRR